METANRTTSELAVSSAHSQIVKIGLPAYAPLVKKRKIISATNPGKRPLGPSVKLSSSESLRLPNPMIGFGVPGMPLCVSREIANEARAAARKRGYIRNLPIEKQSPLLPIPPKIIHEALLVSRTWWPTWDKRTQLDCLLTYIGSAQLTDRIREIVEKWNVEPPESDQKYVIEQCKKWNLVWVGKYKVAVLEPDEMEMLLGFPTNHTRGVSRTERYKALGNSFQVNTVAYHLSVLKPMFPSGMNVLSLFSGIGGAEVALYRLGIPLKNVVSVEIPPVNWKILQDWWK